MADNNYTILAGTLGTGLWRSEDAGENWTLMRKPFPAPGDAPVRCITVYPDDPKRVLAGTDAGIFSTGDGGETWEKVDSPLDGLQIWSLEIDRTDPYTIFAGTKPPGIFRHKGKNLLAAWEKLPVQIAGWCTAVGVPRVLSVKIDPEDSRIVWAGVEVNGVRRSLDGGETWTRVPFPEEDIHSIVISTHPKSVIIGTPAEVFVSRDMGENWQSLVKSHKLPFPYCRGLAIKPDDPRVIYIANGQAAIGSVGTVVRSKDDGKTWEGLKMPVEPNGNMMMVATHPADPNRLICGSRFGEIYTSPDGGDTWHKIKKEFGDLRSIAWLPN